MAEAERACLVHRRKSWSSSAAIWSAVDGASIDSERELPVEKAEHGAATHKPTKKAVMDFIVYSSLYRLWAV